MMFKKTKNTFYKKRHRYLQDCDINIDEVKSKLKNGAILLDVRSVQEYNEGHLDGAIHLSDYEIQNKYNRILPNKEIEIVVYCQNGVRSRKAYKKLRKLGYNNVYILCDGLDNLI